VLTPTVAVVAIISINIELLTRGGGDILRLNSPLTLLLRNNYQTNHISSVLLRTKSIKGKRKGRSIYI